MTDEEKIALSKDGFTLDQIYEIRLGQESGLDVSVYAHKDFFAIQMREIRLGLEHGIQVDVYKNPSISYDRMKQVRRGLEQGVDLSKYLRLEAGYLRQLRKAFVGKVNILEYIMKGYSPDQIDEIRVALECGVDINPYITVELRGMAIRQICEGLVNGLDVSVYAHPEYSWRQMEEIRLGLENRVDVGQYSNPLYGWRQMHEIRIGMEDGVDVSTYKSFMYTAQEMKKRRQRLEQKVEDPLHALLDELQREEQERTKFLDFSLQVSEDDMEAFITVHRSGTRLKGNEIQQALREEGITRGIDQHALHVLENGVTGNNVVRVAEGRKPQDGEDGWYEYFFRTNVARTPKILPDGSVDYRDIEWYEVVHKDQKIAFYHNAKDGVDGYNIKGRILHAKRGKEKKILLGHGFVVEEDGKTYTSQMDGKIDLIGDRIEISRLLVMSEVSLASGNVNFDGSVHVLGDVVSGARIEASENVVVDGHVEDAVIECGGDVMLRKGMNAGSAGGYIRAKNVVGRFFESTKIHVSEDIRADYCMNCDLYADGQILISGVNGSLMGGTSCAVGGINVDNLGNPAGIVTQVKVGISDSILNQQRAILESINGVNQELKILRNAYGEFVLKYTAEERNNMELFLKIESAIYTKELEMEKLQTSKHRLEQVVEQLRGVRVVVRGTLHEGVMIEINGEHWRSKEVRGVAVKNVNHKIVVYSNI
jgi:uncharacterized protein (DUF342 family)